MADDLKNTGKQDDIRINVNQDHELQYWSKILGISPERLKAVVKEVGPLVKNVKAHLGK